MTGWLVFLGVLWLGAIVFGAMGRRTAYRGQDQLEIGLIIRGMNAYSRLLHRVKLEGMEHAHAANEAMRSGRPVVVAPNHTSGVDPLLVQTGLRFEPRWMMAADMRVEGVDWVWQLARIIFVDRGKRDSASLRVALRHLKSGEALGVFPEAHLERPARHVLPFKPGVGLLVKGSGALVLPVVIDGAPQVDPAWSSLWLPSRSRVRYLEPVDYSKSDMDASAIADDLRRRVIEATGWPATDRAPLLQNGEHLLIDLDGRYYDDRTGERLTDEEAHARAQSKGAE